MNKATILVMGFMIGFGSCVFSYETPKIIGAISSTQKWEFLYSTDGAIMGKSSSVKYESKQDCEAGEKDAKKVGVRTLGCRQPWF